MLSRRLLIPWLPNSGVNYLIGIKGKSRQLDVDSQQLKFNKIFDFIETNG